MTAVATVGLGAGVVGGLHPASAAGSPANLVIAKVTVDRTTLAEGDSLQVSFTAKNTGRKKAGKSRTRFYLTRDWTESRAAREASTSNPRSAPADVLLVGEAPVPKLGPGRSAKVKDVGLSVPIGTQPGTYTVLVCADDTGKVSEKSETDNCLPAGKPLGVTPPEGNDGLVVQQFSDSASWPDAEDDDWSVELLKHQCHETVAPKTMSLSKAISTSRSHLEGIVGVGAMQQLDSSGQADTPVEAQELAGLAVMEGVPGLAFASLLKAHELEPRNAGHLINAAGLAVSIGLPNQALAMLDASVSRDLRRPAMGVSQHAIALVIRGEALLLTGRPDAARSMFLSAKGAEPMLSEADAGLAHVEACDDDDEQAKRFIRKSRQRSQEKDEDPTVPVEEEDRPLPSIDYADGKVTPLRQLPLAETPKQAAMMFQVYRDIEAGFLDETEENYTESQAIEEHLRQTDEMRTTAEKERRDDILSLVARAGSDPDIQAMQDDIDKQLELLRELDEEFWGNTAEDPYIYDDLRDESYAACEGSEDPNCYLIEMNSRCRPALTRAHTQWRGLMSELQTMYGEMFAVTSQRMSGYAANLLDEEAHRLAVLEIESSELAHYAPLVQRAHDWAVKPWMFEEECVAPLPADVLAGPESPDVVHSGTCDETRAAMNFVANLGPAKVKVTCEKVQFEVSHEAAPLLHAFAEVSYEFRTGEMSLFAGSKGEGKLGIVEAGFKSGIYLTSNRDGDITDVGWRVGPSASVVGAASEYQVVEDNVDFSFVPVFSAEE